MQHANQPQIEPHVAIENVAELVGNDALELLAGELFGTSAGDADHGIAGRIAGRERVEPLLFGEEENRRHRHARGQRHLFHHIE